MVLNAGHERLVEASLTTDVRAFGEDAATGQHGARRVDDRNEWRLDRPQRIGECIGVGIGVGGQREQSRRTGELSGFAAPGAQMNLHLDPEAGARIGDGLLGLLLREALDEDGEH